MTTVTASLLLAPRKIPMKLVQTYTILAVTVALLAGCGGNEDSTSDDADLRGQQEISTSSGRADDVETMSVDQFLDLTVVQQMDYTGPILNSSVDEDVQLVLDELERSGWADYDYFNREVVQPSADNTSQQIWDQITLGYTHVRHAALTDVAKARKLATGVASNKEYEDLTASLASGGSNFSEVGLAYTAGASPIQSSGSLYGIAANGAPLTSFVKESLTKRAVDRVRVVTRLVSGNEPNSGRWVVMATLRESQ